MDSLGRWSRRLYLKFYSGLVGRVIAGLNVVRRSAATVTKRDKKAEDIVNATKRPISDTPNKARPAAENIKEAKALNIFNSTTWSITAKKNAEKQAAIINSNMLISYYGFANSSWNWLPKVK